MSLDPWSLTPILLVWGCLGNPAFWLLLCRSPMVPTAGAPLPECYDGVLPPQPEVGQVGQGIPWEEADATPAHCHALGRWDSESNRECRANGALTHRHFTGLCGMAWVGIDCDEAWWTIFDNFGKDRDGCETVCEVWRCSRRRSSMIVGLVHLFGQNLVHPNLDCQRSLIYSQLCTFYILYVYLAEI